MIGRKVKDVQSPILGVFDFLARNFLQIIELKPSTFGYLDFL